MKQQYQKSKEQQKIALKRIEFLFNLAKENFKADSGVSDKYVKTARRISMKYKVKVPLKLKKSFCKNCYRYLVPGVNCRTRIHKSRITVYCTGCRHFMRQPIK